MAETATLGRNGDHVRSERGHEVDSPSLMPGLTAHSEWPAAIHLPGLDGVRAIAVLMVIVHHSLYQSNHTTLSQNILQHIAGQGWIGVDLFFVLSGFLITGILMDVRNPTHALRNFYARRILRIVPVYVVFLLFSLWIAPRIGVLSPTESVKLHETQIWYWTYSVNILISLHSWSAISFALSHLWSLAVEEQFYLLWPFVVLALSPIAIRRTTVACIVAAELFRVLVILSGAGGQVNYVMLPARMDSLAAGAFLACAFRDPLLWSRVLRARGAIAACSVAVITAIIAFKHTIANQDPLEQLVAFPAIVALASVAIASAVGSTGWLTNRQLRFVGKISYGMYIWHVFVIRAIQNIVSSPKSNSPNALWSEYAIFVIGTIAVTMLVAFVSWQVVEQPILRLKRFAPYS